MQETLRPPVRRWRDRAGILFMLGALAVPVSAQETAPSVPAAEAPAPETQTQSAVSDDDFADVSLDDLLDTTLVFSASKRAQTIDDSPNAISVITAEDIKAMGAVNIIDVFRRLPGVHVYVRSGNNSVLSIRGRTAAFPSGFLLLVDGVILYDAALGGVDWSRSPVVLDDIERIEVIRGPGGTLYGTNAFYGVINITTKRPANDATFRSVTTGGTENTVHQYASGAYSDGKLGLRLSGKFEQSDGFTKGIAKPDVFDSKTIGSLLGRADYKLSERTTVSGQLATRFGHRDYLGTQVNRPDAENPIVTGYYYAGIKHSPGSDDTIEFKTYGFTMRETYKSLPASFSPGLPAFKGEQTALNNELNWSHAITSEVDLLAGAHHRYQYSYGPGQAFVGWDLSGGLDLNDPNNWSVIDRPRVNQQVASGYLQIEAREGRWLVANAGVRFEYDTFTDTVNPSPRVSLLLRPAENHTFRIGASRATRIPAIFEHSVSGANLPQSASEVRHLIGNQNLRAEKITAIELGYRGNFMDRRYSFNAEGYIQHIQDAIANRGQIIGYAPGTFAGNPIAIATYDNEEDFRAIGLELEGSATPVKWQTFKANYTYTKEFSKESNKVPSLPAAARDTTPPHMIGLTSVTKFPTDTTLFLGGAWHADFTATDNFFNIQTPVDEGFRFDVTLSQSLFEDKLTLSVIGQNVLDTEGANFVSESTSVVAPNTDNHAPRSVYGRLEIKL